MLQSFPWVCPSQRVRECHSCLHFVASAEQWTWNNFPHILKRLWLDDIAELTCLFQQVRLRVL